MKAWQLIEDPKNWCQNAQARDMNGGSCGYSTLIACRWCMQGAIARCYYKLDDYIKILGSVRNKLFDAGEIEENTMYEVIRWNDKLGRNHSEVIKLLKQVEGE